jgi:hypothetical protein
MPLPEHDAWIRLTPTRPIWFFTVTSTSGFTCCTLHDEPRVRASEAYPFRMVRQTRPPAPLALRRRFRPSRPSLPLLWPLLTSRSGFHRRPFRHEARSPQVRTHSFSAQPPDLRHFALTTRASRFYARSPCSAAPSIRFLFIGSQIRSTLPSHGRSPFRSCASLRSLRSAYGRTCTSKSAPMLGAHKKDPQNSRVFQAVIHCCIMQPAFPC